MYLKMDFTFDLYALGCLKYPGARGLHEIVTKQFQKKRALHLKKFFSGASLLPITRSNFKADFQGFHFGE